MATKRRPDFLRLIDLVRRLEAIDRDLRSADRRLSGIEVSKGFLNPYGAVGKAGYSPNEPRDAWGRWTDSGSGTVPPRGPHRHGPLGGLGRNPFVPAVYRPGKDDPVVTPTAGETEVGSGEKDERNNLLEDFVDPLADLRIALFYSADLELRDIDPVNPELERVVPEGWVPSVDDVQRINEALEAAKAAREMARTGEPEPDIWEDGWSTRGFMAERRRGASLPPGFPTIDRFPRGIATSIKSIDLRAPSYQEAWRLEARINYYVDRLAAFNGAKWGDTQIRPQNIRGRSLDLIIPRGSLFGNRLDAVRRSRTRAWRLGIGLITIEY